MAMDKKMFAQYRDLIYAKSGINLGPGKDALVSSRIGRRMRALQIQGQDEYLRFVMEDKTGEELIHLIDAISTNVTSFFREAHHFDVLRHHLSKWVAAGQSRFRFWSAACSSGEEPYSLTIAIQEALGGTRADVKILATDISTRILEKARIGRYAEDKVQTVPKTLRQRYFTVQQEQDGAFYYVQPALRQMVVFQRLNLSHPPFPMKGPFDMVFCRNVMIYFDNETRIRLLGEIHRLLKPGGYLMVGHAESLTGQIASFRSVEPSIYVKS